MGFNIQPPNPSVVRGPVTPSDPKGHNPSGSTSSQPHSQDTPTDDLSTRESYGNPEGETSPQYEGTHHQQPWDQSQSSPRMSRLALNDERAAVSPQYSKSSPTSPPSHNIQVQEASPTRTNFWLGCLPIGFKERSKTSEVVTKSPPPVTPRRITPEPETGTDRASKSETPTASTSKSEQNSPVDESLTISQTVKPASKTPKHSRRPTSASVSNWIHDSEYSTTRLSLGVTLQRITSKTFYSPHRMLDLTEAVERGAQLSSGGYGDVFEAAWTDPALELASETGLNIFDCPKLVIKVLRFYADASPQIRRKQFQRLHREFKVWSRVSHKNLLKLAGVLQVDGYQNMEFFAFVSPFMSNGHVRQYIQDNPGATRMPLIEGLAQGLKYLHNFQPNGIIHGDVKAVSTVHRADFY